MTDTPMKIVVNCETGETTEVPFTAEEIAQREADRLAFEEQRAAQEAADLARAAARESALAKLSALGLTDEEIAAL